MDLKSVKHEIDQYIKISNENKIVLSNNKESIKMFSQELVKRIKEQNLIQYDFLESKVEDICKVCYIYKLNI